MTKIKSYGQTFASGYMSGYVAFFGQSSTYDFGSIISDLWSGFCVVGVLCSYFYDKGSMDPIARVLWLDFYGQGSLVVRALWSESYDQGSTGSERYG